MYYEKYVRTYGKQINGRMTGAHTFIPLHKNAKLRMITGNTPWGQGKSNERANFPELERKIFRNENHRRPPKRRKDIWSSTSQAGQ